MSEVLTDEELQTEDQSSHDGADSQTGNNGGNEELASFLDAYDLGEVTDPQARAVAESYIKRVNAGYTRQRQEDTEAVRNARQAEEVFNALLDPQSAPGIIKALGYELPEPEEDEFDEFDLRDPRVDQLLEREQQRNAVDAARERVQAENAYVTEKIESLQSKLPGDEEYTDEEISLLYLLADENRDQNGIPDVEAAHRILEAAVAAQSTRAARPRPRPKAPRRMAGGQPGERTVDLSDPEKRKEVMLQAWRESQASSE